MASSWWARTAAPPPTLVLHTDDGAPGRACTAARDLTLDILPVDVHDWWEPVTPLKARFSAGGERHSLILAIPARSWQLPRCACAVVATDVRCRWPEVDVESRPVMETSPRNPQPNQFVVCSRCPYCPRRSPTPPGYRRPGRTDEPFPSGSARVAHRRSQLARFLRCQTQDWTSCHFPFRSLNLPRHTAWCG
jgi:hypothetical protein